jgi:hypothetical protein
MDPLNSKKLAAEVESAPVLADKKKLPFVHSFLGWLKIPL